MDKESQIQNVSVNDMPAEEFARYAHALVDWAEDYLLHSESLPVLPAVIPGQIKRLLPAEPPENGEPFKTVIDDFHNIILPGVTHWNHPRFFAYFAITGSAPGILGDFLSTVLNINGMLWKTCPASTELEETALGWAKKLFLVPEGFFGMMVDTASVSTLYALVAAREQCGGFDFRRKGFSPDAPVLRLYCSEQAHSSVEKAAVVAGVGLENVVKVPCDSEFRMVSRALEQAIEADLASGKKPFAVVATIGTTSTTSVDPVRPIGKICKNNNLWLHVDGAYAGAAAILPECAYIMDGFEYVDSYVFNPHKWLGVPFDASLFFVRNENNLRKAFSIVPEYLTTAGTEGVTDFMNYGVQLGRRFRSLKLWFVLRYFGKKGIISLLREHIRLAQRFRTWIEASKDFEVMAPTPFSVVCFRYNPFKTQSGGEHGEIELEKMNRALMDSVNASGRVYLSHTKLNSAFVLRLAVGNFRTAEIHVREAWNILRSAASKLPVRGSGGR